MINRNAILVGGIKPHYYCLPVAKRREHKAALSDILEENLSGIQIIKAFGARRGLVAGVLLLHSVGLTALGTLFAAITSRIGRGEALLAGALLAACSDNPSPVAEAELARSADRLQGYMNPSWPPSASRR